MDLTSEGQEPISSKLKEKPPGKSKSGKVLNAFEDTEEIPQIRGTGNMYKESLSKWQSSNHVKLAGHAEYRGFLS